MRSTSRVVERQCQPCSSCAGHQRVEDVGLRAQVGPRGGLVKQQNQRLDECRRGSLLLPFDCFTSPISVSHIAGSASMKPAARDDVAARDSSSLGGLSVVDAEGQNADADRDPRALGRRGQPHLVRRAAWNSV